MLKTFTAGLFAASLTALSAALPTGVAHADTVSCVNYQTDLAAATVTENATATAVTNATAERATARNVFAVIIADERVRRANRAETAAAYAVAQVQAGVDASCGAPVVVAPPPLISVGVPIGVGIGIGAAYNHCL